MQSNSQYCFQTNMLTHDFTKLKGAVFKSMFQYGIFNQIYSVKPLGESYNSIILAPSLENTITYKNKIYQKRNFFISNQDTNVENTSDKSKQKGGITLHKIYNMSTKKITNNVISNKTVKDNVTTYLIHDKMSNINRNSTYQECTIIMSDSVIVQKIYDESKDKHYEFVIKGEGLGMIDISSNNINRKNLFLRKQSNVKIETFISGGYLRISSN